MFGEINNSDAMYIIYWLRQKFTVLVVSLCPFPKFASKILVSNESCMNSIFMGKAITTDEKLSFARWFVIINATKK